MKTNFTILCIIATFICIGSLSISAQSADPPSIGDGSLGAPYQIATLNNLYWITQNSGEWVSGKYFIQTADIDATSTSGWDTNQGLSPIGNSTNKFEGSYDGQGHTISNLTIYRGSTDYIGLFGYTNGATIANLGLTSISILGKEYVGGLVGRNSGSAISDCHITGSLTGDRLCGGLLGSSESSSSVDKCYTDVSMEADEYAGGCVGYNHTSIISNSYSLGDIQLKISGTSSSLAGFCGQHGNTSSAKIEYCYSIGSIYFLDASNPTDQGFVGIDNSGEYTSNFWDSDASNQSSTGSSSYATAKTTAEMKDVATFTDYTDGSDGLTLPVWDFTGNPNDDVANNNYWDINGGYPFLSSENTIFAVTPSGSGTSGSPYEIATLNNLRWITQNSGEWVSGKYFIQTADIDASTTSIWEGGAGFFPIGNTSMSFQASYDGQYYSIDGLYINRPSTNDVGFFGAAAFGVVIEKLKLTNVTVYGNEYVGGLVGLLTSSGTVSQCSVSGSVDGENRTGGLIGEIQTSSIVELCSSSADVTSTTRLGGFVYYIKDNSTVRNCYSLGDVTRKTGGTSTYEGAFCGFYDSDCSIENCYSIGSVYFTGATDPEDRGFCGYDNSGTTTNNFWDSEASNQSTAIGATSKTTALMKTSSTFTDAGWSGSVWNRDDGVNNGYPHLDWQNPSGTPLPVELTSFQGTATNEGVLLNWETATEINNYGFEVERSQAILSGVEEWVKVGFVLGNGTTNSPKDYLFTDLDLPNVESVDYRLKQIDNDGTFAYSKIITVDLTTITDVEDEIEYEFALEQNYPNPFNPSTTIKFTIPSDVKRQTQDVKLIVYDILGREVATLVNQKLQPGNHEVQFDASTLSSGMYFYRIDVGSQFESIKKMLLLK